MSAKPDPHYLHAKVGLTPVVKPPVRDVCAMSWAAGQRLVVATRSGEGWVVHPVQGTTRLWTGRAAAIGIAARGADVVVVEADGRWRRLRLGGPPGEEGGHPFSADVRVQLDDHAVLMCGSTPNDRRAKFFVDGKKALRVLLPPGATARFNGAVHLVRSLTTGLDVLPLEPGARFKPGRATDHRLHVEGDHVIGVGADDARVWTSAGELRAAVRVPSVTTATLTTDGRMLAAGTSDGGVAFADLATTIDGAEPPTVHISRAPVADLAFSDTGRWLASGADLLAIWAWDAQGA